MPRWCDPSNVFHRCRLHRLGGRPALGAGAPVVCKEGADNICCVARRKRRRRLAPDPNLGPSGERCVQEAKWTHHVRLVELVVVNAPHHAAHHRLALCAPSHLPRQLSADLWPMWTQQLEHPGGLRAPGCIHWLLAGNIHCTMAPRKTHIPRSWSSAPDAVFPALTLTLALTTTETRHALQPVLRAQAGNATLK